MEAVEEHFSPLAGQLPKDYERFEDDVLEEMMRTFDSDALRTVSGDVLGRIYEYFLAEFSKQGEHDWSLTPGGYVGVAPEQEDEDFDFAEAIRSIHMDLEELNGEAATLAARIARSFEKLGV